MGNSAQADPTGGLADKVSDDLTSTLTKFLLEAALSEASTGKTPATPGATPNQGESDHRAFLEENVDPLRKPAQGLMASDVELLKSLTGVLSAYALKYNIGTKMVIGAQPARDLTVATPKVFNSVGVVLLTYAQRYQAWGTCVPDKACMQEFWKS